MINWQFNPYTLPLIVGVVLMGILWVYLWPHRSRPGAASFLFLVSVAGEWCLTYALEMLAVPLRLKFFWVRLEYLGIPFLAVAWLCFALEITGRSVRLTRRRLLALSIIPVLTIILVWTTELHGLVYRSMDILAWGPYSIFIQEYGPWFWVNISYSYLLVFAGTLHLLFAFDWKHNIFRSQGISLVIGALLPWVGNLGYLTRLFPIPNYDWTPVLFSISGFLLFFALLRFKLLDLVPLARTTVIQSMHEGVIVLDQQNRILELNRAAAELLKTPHLDLIGTPIQQAFPTIASRLPAEVCQAQLLEMTLPLLDKERILEVDISPLVSGNRSLLQSSKDQALGRLLVFRDITERERMEAELRASEESYHGLFNSLMEAVYIQDRQGTFLEVNQGAQEMYGYPRSFFIGKTPAAIAAADRNDLDELENLLARAFEGTPQRFEFWGQRSTGEVFPKEVRLYKGSYFGEDVIVALATDITERKKVEQSIRATNLELEKRVNQRTADLKAAYQELETITSSFSQDLRLPLDVLEEETRRLVANASGKLDDTGLSSLEDILRALDQMNSLVEGLENLSRYTRADMIFETVNLSDLVQECLWEFRQQEPERLVSLTVQPNLLVYGDTKMLRVMIHHLLSNAWKYTRVRPQTVLDFGVQVESGRKVFYLKDNGIGFDLAMLGKLFVPFQHLHRGADDDGIGLGLATAQRIIRRHGGDIWAYSEAGRGASFFFYLEVLEPDFTQVARS